MKVIVAAAVLGSMLPLALGFCCGGDGSGICGDGSRQGAGCCGVGPCNIFCCNCDGGNGSMLLPVAISLPLPRLKLADSFSAKNARVAAQTRREATFLKSSRSLTPEPSGRLARLISLALGPSLFPNTSNIWTSLPTMLRCIRIGWAGLTSRSRTTPCLGLR